MSQLQDWMTGPDWAETLQMIVDIKENAYMEIIINAVVTALQAVPIISWLAFAVSKPIIMYYKYIIG